VSGSHPPNPFGEKGVTEQLDSWASALEMAVAKLTQTLTEVRSLREKGTEDDGTEQYPAEGWE
jgi:hypothetical protein